MNIHLRKKSIVPKHKQDGRINPHRFWMIFVAVFITVLIVEIVSLTFLFVISAKKLDKPVMPKIETNSSQIRKIEDKIKKTEDAVSARTGKTLPSQNDAPIVQ